MENVGGRYYSVQLNDSDSLAWEPVRCDRQKDIGRLEIWPMTGIAFNCCQIAEFKQLQAIPVISVIVVGVAGIVTGAWEHNG